MLQFQEFKNYFRVKCCIFAGHFCNVKVFKNPVTKNILAQQLNTNLRIIV